jgi:hypothetical protein
MAQDDAIVRLARQIDAARRSERFLVDPDEIAALRRRGACELHRICAEFAASVNSRLEDAAIELSPPGYEPQMFRDTGVNLLQIGSEGREIQLAFESPPQAVSTVKFPVPYILEGELRAYNQRMLERFEIQTRLIFFCVERETAEWRFYDWRTRHTGLVGAGLLADLMESLF